MPGESWPDETAETAVCPTCDHRVRKLPTDDVLTCHSCGWRKRTPLSQVLGLVTGIPLPSSRTLIPLGLLLIAIGGCVQLGVPDDVVGGYENVTEPSSDSSVATPFEGQTTVQSNINEPAAKINNGLVESYFLGYLNQRRGGHDRRPLEPSEELTAMGMAQARDMAVNDSYSHTDSHGRSIKERYEARGLLPECRLSVDGSDQYLPGAENIAQSYVFVQYQTNYGEGTRVNDGERELAIDLLKQWWNSPPHRKVLLLESAQKGGLGIYITESGRVYAALELC